MAVNVGATATPLLPVVALAVVSPPANVPLGPLDGAANVTGIPLMGFPLESVTVAASAVGNAVFTLALWGVPAEAAILGALPPFNAMAFNVTFPVPELMIQLTVRVWPADAAEYVNV